MADNLLGKYSDADDNDIGPLRFVDIGGVFYAVSILAQADGTLLSTFPISAASLPLPTGAATAANQATGNTSLSSIDTKTPALGQALAANSVPVVLTAAQLTTLTPPAAITGFATLAEQQTQTTHLTTIIGHVDGVESALTNTNAFLDIIDDWDETNRCKVNLIVGQAGITAGAGAVAANTPRVTLASDDPIAATTSTSLGAAPTRGVELGFIDSGTFVLVSNGSSGTGLPVQAAGGQALPISIEDFNISSLPVKGTGTAGTADANVITIQGIASMTPIVVSNGGTFAVQVSSALPAGTNNIGDVDVLTVPADPFGANADAASATGSISAKLRFIASTGIPITGTVTVGSHAVTNAGTFAVQDDARTTGGESSYSFLSTATVQAAEIKGSAGTVYTMQFFNKNAAPMYVRLYNQTGSPANTDTANIVWRGMIPGNTAAAGYVVNFPKGKAFSTGIGIRVTSAIADNDNTALGANEVMGNVGYK